MYAQGMSAAREDWPVLLGLFPSDWEQLGRRTGAVSRFATALVHELPYGKCEKWGGDAPALVKQALGNWQVSSSIRLASGLRRIRCSGAMTIT
jgi:hypothetical protein